MNNDGSAGPSKQYMGLVSTPRCRRRFTTLWLIGGFLSLTAALVAARRTPASGYEVSVYASTPTAFWAGVAVALATTLLVGVAAVRSRERCIALLLGSLAVASIAGLPLLRSYRFHGRYDPLTHLGWTRALVSESLNPFQLLYPAAHTVASFVSLLGGVPVTRAMMFVVWLLALVFLAFVPLCALLVADDRRALLVAGVSAFALLPINTISTYLHFHPYTLTTLFFPFFLYLLLAHLTRRHEDDQLPWWLSATTLVLPLVGVGVVLFHPQVALNVVIFLGVVAAVQFLLSRYTVFSVGTRRVYAQFGFLAVVFVAWVVRFGATVDLLTNILNLLAAFLTGTLSNGGVVEHQANSAAEYGLSLLELFVKLFLVSAVYSVLAAGLVGMRALAYLRVTGRRHVPHGTVRYFGVGGAVLTVFFAAHLLGEVSTYFFRHLGFAMVLASVVGSAGVAAFSRRIEASAESIDVRGFQASVRGALRTLGVVCAALVLVLSLVSVFPSPYLYQPGQHVTDQQMSSYETFFDHRVEGAGIAGIESAPHRFSDANHERVDGQLLWSLNASDLDGRLTNYTQSGYFNRSFYYVAVSETDYEREGRAYRELQMSRERIASIRGRPAVSRIHTSGGVTLYFVEQPSSVLTESARTYPALDGISRNATQD